ncbi:hypothetical protein GCM10010372_59660 [Streptomyces tauricus]|nr:hypothetical protein GCM10010372_59660 [Streptomyces tauricus]
MRGNESAYANAGAPDSTVKEAAAEVATVRAKRRSMGAPLTTVLTGGSDDSAGDSSGDGSDDSYDACSNAVRALTLRRGQGLCSRTFPPSTVGGDW